MKLLVASDLHGSSTHVDMLFERIEEERPDRIVLLGDLLYHGPRNDLPDGYAPRKWPRGSTPSPSASPRFAETATREVDQMVLDFPCMADYAQMVVEGATLTFTHGHVIDPASSADGRVGALPLPAGSFFFSGTRMSRGSRNATESCSSTRQRLDPQRRLPKLLHRRRRKPSRSTNSKAGASSRACALDRSRHERASKSCKPYYESVIDAS